MKDELRLIGMWLGCSMAVYLLIYIPQAISYGNWTPWYSPMPFSYGFIIALIHVKSRAKKR